MFLMKYIYLIFFGIIISSCQPKKETVEVDSQKVKMILESLHEPTGKLDELGYSPEVSENTFIHESQFNRKGQLIRKSRFDSDGNLKSISTFRYDSRGNNIRVDEIASNGLLISKTISQFDANNLLVERNEVDARDQVISKQQLEHHKDGHRWLVTYKKNKGRLVKRMECVFDKNGLNVFNNYYTQETLKKKEIQAYDPNGMQDDNSQALTVQLMMSEVEKNDGNSGYLDDGTLKKSEQHEYDSNGNRMATIQYFPMTNQRITTRYKYGPGRLETATLLSNKIVSSKKIVRYDPKQNVIETYRYGLGGRLEEHQRHLYEYDPAGNWTKHKTIINNKSISMIIRQLQYY